MKGAKDGAAYVVSGASELLAGCCTESREEVQVSDPQAVVITRYFVAANVVLGGRHHALLAVSSYFGTLAGAEQELARQIVEYPNAAVLSVNSRYHLSNPAHAAEFAEVVEQAQAEMREAGYQ